MIIIHEYGEPSHYLGAVEANKRINSHVTYYEFSIIKFMIKGIMKKDAGVFFKAIRDFLFLSLFYVFPFLLKDKLVIIGIAPVDFRIVFFNRILKYAKVTYHTSWMIWDGSKFPKRNKFLSSFFKREWDFFISDIADSFAVVTETVKDQLIKQMGVEPSKIEVVYHSYDESIFMDNRNGCRNEHLNVIFAGRLVKNKGIDEFLEIVKDNPNINFYIIGKGDEESKVKNACGKFKNLSFIGYVSSRTELAQYYNLADFILLPSKRTKNWEELFGMVIIEAMACGCIPICTDHNGPMIILKDDVWRKNIIKENCFVLKTNELLQMYRLEPKKMEFERQKAINTAIAYSKKNISLKWYSVFKKSGAL